MFKVLRFSRLRSGRMLMRHLRYAPNRPNSTVRPTTRGGRRVRPTRRKPRKRPRKRVLRHPSPLCFKAAPSRNLPICLPDFRLTRNFLNFINEMTIILFGPTTRPLTANMIKMNFFRRSNKTIRRLPLNITMIIRPSLPPLRRPRLMTKGLDTTPGPNTRGRRPFHRVMNSNLKLNSSLTTFLGRNQNRTFVNLRSMNPIIFMKRVLRRPNTLLTITNGNIFRRPRKVLDNSNTNTVTTAKVRRGRVVQRRNQLSTNDGIPLFIINRSGGQRRATLLKPKLLPRTTAICPTVTFIKLINRIRRILQSRPINGNQDHNLSLTSINRPIVSRTRGKHGTTVNVNNQGLGTVKGKGIFRDHPALAAPRPGPISVINRVITTRG